MAASLTLSPSTALTGSTITISAAGFPAHKKATVTMDGALLFTAQASRTGAFSRSVVITAMAGQHTITATSGMTVVSATLTIQAPAPPPPPTGFVQRSGTTLTLDGNPYRPVGLNFPSAVEAPCEPYPKRFGDAMRDITGLDIARVWATQSCAVTNGARDWTAIDLMLTRAEAYGRKVIMVLTDQWQAPAHQPCHDANADRTLAWFQTGYKTTPDAYDTVTFKAWCTEIATRYADRTSIAFWQIMNEPFVEPTAGDLTNPCPGETTAREALRAFADDCAATLKAADPNHLVSLGANSGACGTNQTNYAYVHSGADIDIADYHDYVGTGTNIPGDQYNGLGVSITRIHNIGKVILVGESGINWATLGITQQQRATAFQNKITAQFTAGTSGFLMWTWGGYSSTNPGYEIPYGDPSLTVIANN